MAGRIGWFPGHMVKATRDLQRVLKQVDLVLEVRDARLPFSSSNDNLEKLIRGKRRIVVLNKCDLADEASSKAALQLLLQQQQPQQQRGDGAAGRPAPALLTCTHQLRSIRRLLDAALGWLRAERPSDGVSLMMVAGVPNAGKSRLINALKLAARGQGILPGRQAYNRTTLTGDTPGLTRRVEGFQVCSQPDVYVLDTPGVMQKRVRSQEEGLKLSLAGIVKDSIAGEDRLVAYLLEILGKNERHRRALVAAARRLGNASASSSSSAKSNSSTRGGSGREGGGDQGRSIAAAAAPPPPPPPSPAPAQRRQLLSICDALLHASSADLPAEPWHPGLEDEGGDGDGGDGGSDPGMGPEGRLRLEILLEALGVDAGARDPGKRRAALARVLAAFRSGELGRYTLDDL